MLHPPALSPPVAAVWWRFAQLVRLLLLTGARLREVMCAEWSWVDWQRSVLLVPAERGKTGAAEVQLSQRAVAILRELQAAQAAVARVSDDLGV